MLDRNQDPLFNWQFNHYSISAVSRFSSEEIDQILKAIEAYGIYNSHILGGRGEIKKIELSGVGPAIIKTYKR